MSEVNKNPSIYPRTCTKCKKIFKNRHAYWKHTIGCSGSVIICDGCGHVYRSRLIFHEHNCQNRKNKQTYKKMTECIAPNCQIKFFRRTEMLKHLEAVHSNPIKESIHNFISMADFEKWKDAETEKNFTYFRKQNGTRKLKDVEYTSFVCQFDAPNRKEGSKIPNLSCPARMRVSKDSKGQVSVKYISTHNHPLTKANLKYQPYPKNIVNFIRNLLINGSEAKTVYKILKNKSNDPDFSHLKEHPMQMKYINNIKYQLKATGQLGIIPIETRFNHKQSVKIPANDIKKTSNSTWLVISNDINFTVEQFHSKCPQPEDCLYRCFYSSCNGLCGHMYTCSCSVGSLCEHIHKVQSLHSTKAAKTEDMKILFEEHDCISGIKYKENCIEMPDHVYVPQEMILIENVDDSIEQEPENEQIEHVDNSNKQEPENEQIKNVDNSNKQEPENEQIQADKTENYRSVGEDLLKKLASAYEQANPDILPEMNQILKNSIAEFSKFISL